MTSSGPITFDKTILSRSNVLISEWFDLSTSKGIRKHGLFIIAGERAVRETLQRFPRLARSLIVCADRHAGSPIVHEARTLASQGRNSQEAHGDRFSVIAVGREIFNELDVNGTHQPLLLARTPEIPDAGMSAAPKGLEILCALGDPSNVGALLRSAAAFGASRIVLLKESASPFHPKAVRAASASTLLTTLTRGPSIRELPSQAESGTAAGPFVALDMHGVSLANFQWPKDVRLLIGEEGPGVPLSKAFQYLTIPMAKNVESLNATVAASVALYSYAAMSAR